MKILLILIDNIYDIKIKEEKHDGDTLRSPLPPKESALLHFDFHLQLNCYSDTNYFLLNSLPNNVHEVVQEHEYTHV